jgi:tetratricopeptide (TPR) repeat protein
VMDEYFASVASAIEHHGGTVEKYIGDAVMAVFGVPRLHEDDPMRALRAAADVLRAIKALNGSIEQRWGVRLAVRIGVHTGEVVASLLENRRERLVTGDAVNLAARLEEAARIDEIVISDATYRFVAGKVAVLPIERLTVRGRPGSVAAYRVKDVLDSPAPKRIQSPFVGRRTELRRLLDAFEGVATGSQFELFTILGTPGVGKSRLVDHLELELGARARFIRGHCLSYGRGVTYHPIVEIVHAAAGIETSDTAEVARRKIDELTGIEPDGAEIAHRLAQAIGLKGGDSEQGDLFWAVRRCLDSIARQRPLVAVVDDIHWAEPTLLDLLDYLAGWVRDVPLLLVCIARPELLDQRPDWGGGKRNTTTVFLEPFAIEAAAQMIDGLAGAGLPLDVRTRITEASGGNPLYIEEMFRKLVDDGVLRRQAGEWVAESPLPTMVVPGTIQALLAARLDQLEPNERAVAQHAAVVGQTFDQASVSELLPEPLSPDIDALLRSLTHKEVLKPDGPAERSFRFRHELIRDAAYASLAKEDRADLHERFADWVASSMGERVSESESIVGHHLDQAFRYRTELGLADAATLAVRRRAAQWLARSGMAAKQRRDGGAAVALLSRALELLDRDDPLFALTLTEYGDLVGWQGNRPEAKRLLRDAISIGRVRDPAAARRARLYEIDHVAKSGKVTPELKDAARKLAEEFAASNEDGLSATTLSMLGAWLKDEGDVSSSEALLAEALLRAERSGDPNAVADALIYRVWLGARTTRPCLEVLEDCRRVLATPGLARWLKADALEQLAYLLAMREEFDEARDAIRQAAEITQELDLDELWIGRRHVAGLIEQLAGNAAAAAASFRAAYELAKDSPIWRLAMGTRLAHSLVLLGRDDEATALLGTVDPMTGDIESKTELSGTRARILARQGRVEEGVALVIAMIDAARGAGLESEPNLFGGALQDAAAVMQEAGRWIEAEALLAEAVSRYEAKGNMAAARLARDQLAGLTKVRGIEPVGGHRAQSLS